MKTATVSEFRAKMREHLENVEKDQDVLILSGPKRKDFVLITLDRYNSMEETAHLLSTPVNTEKLMESIAQDKAGIVAHAFNLDELGTRKKASVAQRSKKTNYQKATDVVAGKRSNAKKRNMRSIKKRTK